MPGEGNMKKHKEKLAIYRSVCYIVPKDSFRFYIEEEEMLQMIRSVKTARTHITDEKLANLNKNIAQFDWAKEKADEILRDADAYLAYGIEKILINMTPQELARSFDVSQEHGCPHCGMEMMRYGNYGWLIDWEKHPWKVKCPHCGNLYPSNDFGTFYESGLDENGVFSYTRADRSLLVNDLYPEMGPDFAVDDGRGWLRYPEDPETGRYTFIAYYIYNSVWSPNASYNVGCCMSAMQKLSMAYLITGDRTYGYAAGALYYKFALIYPTLDVRAFPWKAGYKQCHGHSGLGRMVGNILDSIYMREIVQYYDRLFPCLDDDFAAYLAENSILCMGQPPRNGLEVREVIENNIHYLQFPDYRNAFLDCNPGPDQMNLLVTAKVLDRSDLFDEYADYLLRFIDRVQVQWNRIELETMLLEMVDRDGFAAEISPGYNAIWTDGFLEAATLLRGHKDDLFRHPRFCKLASLCTRYVTADAYTLPLADHGRTGNPEIFVSNVNAQVQYFLATRNVQDAQLLVKVAGDGPICTDLFEDCEAVDRLIRETAAQAGPFHSQSRIFPRFGLAMIESHPDGKDPESNGVYFGSNWGHGHRDTMNLMLHGFGIDMMPDFGNPNFKDPNPERYRWTSNMASHNTVTIRQDAPFTENTDPKHFPGTVSEIRGGKIHHYYTDGKVSLIDVETPNLYGVPYGRTAVTVDLDGKSRYLVDLFTAGGKEQHLSWHAAGVDTVASGAAFIPQNGGTYAGAEIPYADATYNLQMCDGFNYLTDVRRAKIDGAFSVDWKCFDNWHVWKNDRDVHVKIHMISGVDEAALCTGQPPQAHPGNPRAFAYLMAKHTGGEARFVSVLEPYEDASFIASCIYAAADGKEIITVIHTNGRKDTITLNHTGNSAVLTVESTTGYRMTYGETVLKGTVECFTKELSSENDVTVRFASDVDASVLVGGYIDIDTTVDPNAFFAVTSAEHLGDGLWKLGTGDCSFITGFVNRDHKELGYTYCIREGAAVIATL